MPDPALQREFWTALARDDFIRIRQVVGEGADPNLPIGNLGAETPLIRAVTSGNSELVRLLLELGADINLPSQGPKNWTPLMYAHEDPAMISGLIAAGANPNAKSTAYSIGSPEGGTRLCPGGVTTLHLAAATGNGESVRTLIQAGADVEACTEDGCAPLDYALRLGSSNEAAEALVEAGAKLTPPRLELMHAAAHRPDSDLLTFPLPIEPESRSGQSRENPGDHTAKPASDSPTDSKNNPAAAQDAYHCPNCHSLLYSRRARLCGQCGAILPPELVLTDQQVEAQSAQRQWARDLAEKFDTRPRSEKPHASVPARQRPHSRESGQTLSPQDLLRSVSCAAEFRHRDRPDFWLSALGYTFSFLVILFLFLKLRFPPASLLFFLVILAWQCFRAWNRASPICPNCKQNIRFCPAEYCHVCGQVLRDQRCAACSVDISWTSHFLPYANSGNFHWVTYCPSCAAHLDTKVPRWRFGGRD